MVLVPAFQLRPPTRHRREDQSHHAPHGDPAGATAQRMVFVDRGEAVEVNRRKFTGPLYVARQSTLREVSFVALGADDQTVARMAAERVRSRESGDWSQTDVRHFPSSGRQSPDPCLSL
uniref:Uncharacterized protein n=1 Tax=Schlesneria paludicola TaxID=360056 RepID=A0A7C4QQB0_9PLAN